MTKACSPLVTASRGRQHRDAATAQEAFRMAVKLLYLGLLLALLCPSLAKEKPCFTPASHCDECIQFSPQCAWCTAPRAVTRCDSLEALRSAGCPESYIYNPRGMVQIIKNDSSTETTDAKALVLQPQELSLRLRPGKSQSFPLTITMPTDQPVPELTMDTSNVPAGVNITLSSVTAGNPLLIQVKVEAAQCPSGDSNQNRTGPWSVHITPKGFSLSVKLEITLECQCNCTKDREENSSACSGHGALECGRCDCYSPHIGFRCHMDLDSLFTDNDDLCRSGPDAPVCTNRGICILGICECLARENPKERYSGQYCECSNFDCPRYNNRMCGGHGRCECGQCICDDNWTGEDCSCSLETASCMATNQQLCNGKGLCQCGECKCEPPHSGPTCEDCPSCI